MFYRLTDAHARYNINQDDLVIIQWTNFAREDRYMHGSWQTAGNIFTQQYYPKEWVAQWFDLRGALLKTSGCIAGATHLLQTTGCEFHFHSMMPMQLINEKDELFMGNQYQDIFDVYQQYYDLVNISMVEYLYGSIPICRNPNPAKIKLKDQDSEGVIDHHPTPKQHLKFLESYPS
jgi:hypothetical protein